jgi:hypothetical protein
MARSGRFLRDLAACAGTRGIAAITLAGLGAFLENFGVVLLVPIFAVITGTEESAGRRQIAVDAINVG